MRSRWAGYALRAASLVAFVWYLWSVPYALHGHEPFGDADSEAAIRAIDAGYPFHLLYENGEQQAPTIRRMSDVYGDYGLPMAVGFVAQAQRWLNGPSFRVDPTMGRKILLLLFVATSVAMLAPSVPLPVALAGVISLFVLFAWGPMTIGPAQHWGVAYVTVVTAVFLGCVLKPWTASRACALAALGALAALSQLLRQEGGTVPTAVGLTLIATAGLILLARRSASGARGLPVRRLAQRAAVGGLLLFALNAAVQPIERWMLSRASGASYSETPAAAHGAGAPLYLSLGYVSNPYNIGWRDPIGAVHAGLITPGLLFANPTYQPTLRREFLIIVISRPWLLLKNVAAKAARVHALAMRHAERLPDVAVWQLPAHALLYQALPWLLGLCVALLWWRGTPEAAAIGVASAALAAAGSAGALVVFPDYIGGVQGATVALALIVPAAIASCLIEPAPVSADMTRLARHILAWSVALAGGALAIGGAFVAIQWTQYRALQEKTLARDPLEAIGEQQFRYAHVFNDLPVTRQGRVVALLTAANDPRIARGVDLRRGDLDLFRPEVLVRTATQLHLIAWMGQSFQPPVPQLYQGTTHALVFICGECPQESTVNDFPFDSGWTMVNDLEWQGRYRMFSVSLNPKLTASHFFLVAAEKVVALDSSVQSTGLRPGLISSARISY